MIFFLCTPETCMLPLWNVFWVLTWVNTEHIYINISTISTNNIAIILSHIDLSWPLYFDLCLWLSHLAASLSCNVQKCWQPTQIHFNLLPSPRSALIIPRSISILYLDICKINVDIKHCLKDRLKLMWLQSLIHVLCVI